MCLIVFLGIKELSYVLIPHWKYYIKLLKPDLELEFSRRILPSGSLVILSCFRELSTKSTLLSFFKMIFLAGVVFTSSWDGPRSFWLAPISLELHSIYTKNLSILNIKKRIFKVVFTFFDGLLRIFDVTSTSETWEMRFLDIAAKIDSLRWHVFWRHLCMATNLTNHKPGLRWSLMSSKSSNCRKSRIPLSFA